MAGVENDISDAVRLIEDLARDALVPGIDVPGCFVSETDPVAVDQYAVREDKHRWFCYAGARIHGLGVVTAKVTAGRGADVERHPDAFALVVITAAAHWPQENR